MAPATPAPALPAPAHDLPPGSAVAIVLGDGSARLGMRLHDGLAVCTAPMPADLDRTDEAAVERWFCAEARLWILATEAAPCWVFARWWPGRGEPNGYDEDAVAALCEEYDTSGGLALLDVAEAVVSVAAGVFPGWAEYTPFVNPGVRMDAVWRRPGAVDAEA